MRRRRRLHASNARVAYFHWLLRCSREKNRAVRKKYSEYYARRVINRYHLYKCIVLVTRHT